MSSIASPSSKKRKTSWRQRRRAYESAAKTYLSRPDVTGVDIGYKYVDGERTRKVCVRIHLQEKRSPEAVPESEMIPDEILGIETDVLQAVYEARSSTVETTDRRLSRSKVQPGMSVSGQRTCAGTIGSIVFDLETGKPGILSNWHVLAGSREARPGEAVFQPGLCDGAGRDDQVARLRRVMINRRGDAAVGQLNRRRPVDFSQFGTGVVVTETRRVRLGNILEKSGRGTGITRAKVDGIGIFPVDIAGLGRRPVLGFKLVPRRPGNPRNEEISEPGDSGSLWYDSRGVGVGLHMAGERSPRPRDEHAICCHLGPVLEELSIRLPRAADSQDAEAATESRRAVPTHEPVAAGDWQLVEPREATSDAFALAEWAGANRSALAELAELGSRLEAGTEYITRTDQITIRVSSNGSVQIEAEVG